MIQNSVDHRSNEVRFTKKQNIQSYMDCPLEIHKALFVFVFCTNPIIENFLKKKQQSCPSSNHNHPHWQVKEDVLGLLGIEGGLFGLVGRWLVFFFVVLLGFFHPGRIDGFNDDQCVFCLETLVFLRDFW